jgi:hypothetical protein
MRNLFVCFAVLTLCFACDKPAEAPKADAPAVVDAPKADAPPAELAMVEVPATGKEFNPPVKPEQIPAGAYYCDMGTVEYARMEEGDGKCAVCGMMLKHKPAADAAPAADAPAAPAEDHAGHGH